MTNEARAEDELAHTMPCKEEIGEANYPEQREQYQVYLNFAESYSMLKNK